MTKSKKSVVAGLIALSMACCVAGAVAVGGGVHLTARADNEFNADTEGGAVYPGGQTKATVLAALNKKVQDLNADIQAVLDGEGDLETAYAEGEILAYSLKNNGIINQDNKRSGWKVWEGAAVLDLKCINAGYNESWVGGDKYMAWLSYNGTTNEAYIITAEFAVNYGSNGNQKLGSAASDMFRVGDVTYQNFTNGYMKLEDGSVTVVNKKNVDESGAEKDADPASTGFIGAAEESTLSKAGVPAEQFAQAFTDAYNRYKAEGFNVGYPFSPVMDNGKNSGGDSRYGTLCSQNFRWGDSVSDPWNDGGRSQWSFLAYNFEEGRVYLIANEFHRQFEGVASGDVLLLGDPASDAFEANGNRYQNFEKGYMMASGTTPQNTGATVVLGKTVASDGTISDIDVQSKIGKLGKTVTDKVLPQGYTAETFSAAFKAAYEEKVAFYKDEELQGVDLVTYENGIISQSYTDSKGQAHKLVYANESETFVYLRPAVVSKMSGLGAPTAERIQVAETKDQKIYAYPFENGYMKLTVSQQLDMEDGAIVTVTTEVAVATQGTSFDSEKVFFETTSYSNSITADMVNESALNSAYWTIWGVEKPTAEAVAAAFKDAYDKAFALGFSAGQPSSEGIVWWKTGESGVLKLTLKGGNGNASFFQDNTLMTYNPEMGKVFITTGEIGSKYAGGGASGLGWATTEMLINTATGVIVQQFDITDTVVTHRQVYLIVVDGKASDVNGVYDFEANKGSGEWVEYLSQFGGSISSKPLSVETVRTEGEKVEIDFAQYVNNPDGYKVTWNKISGKGTLSADGKYTLDAMTAENDTVEVEVYSAFDKLSFKVTLTTSSQGGNDKPDPKPGNDNEGNGLSKGAIAGICVGSAAAVGGIGVGAYFLIKRRKK